MKRGILIIDDCEGAREALRSILRGYEISLAGTAEEGLKMLSEKIGLVFLDIRLPDLNGLEVLKKIKNNYPSIPVVIITAYGTEELCINILRLGGRDYIKKPFNLKEILKKTEMLINLHSITPKKRYTIPLIVEDDNVYSKTDCKDIPIHILRGILNVKDYIEKNYPSPLNLSDASKMAGVNVAYFCKYFKLITGSTFKNYLNNKRLNIAKEVFKNKNLKVNDVAEMVGYSSKYFSDAFKKTHGTSPKNLKS